MILSRHLLRQRMPLMLLLLLVGIPGSVVGQGPRTMTISAILDEDGDEIHELAFNHAVEVVNRNRDILPGVELKAHVEKVRPGDTFMAEKKTCQLLAKGTVAILGPRSKANSEHIRSITDSVEVPFIETRWNYRPQDVMGSPRQYAFNLHPDITTLGSAYLDVIETYAWKTITILYQDNDSLMTLKEIFTKTANIAPTDEFKIVLKQLARNENGYRDVLKEIFQSESNLIVMDCEKFILEEVLRQSQQVGLISPGYFFLLTSLDTHTVDLDNFKHGGTNFSAFRMIDVEKPDVKNVIYSIAHNAVLESGVKPGLQLDGNLDTATALIYDSVHAFALALHELSSSQLVAQRPLDCSGRTSWPHGNSLINYMKMVEFVGLSGPIQFDESGLRTQFAMSLMELQMDGLVRVGSWNSLDRISVERPVSSSGNLENVDPMANKTFVFTTILGKPYMMWKEDKESLKGNNRFEGFCFDLTQEMGRLLGFNYTIKLVDDKKYGNEVGAGSGNWNGMIKEVMDGTADFAIADISITSERASVVDFTMPWMNLGISILYVKARPAPPNLLAFKEPFTNKVYVATLLVFVFVTLIIYVLARFSPNQWEEPPNCIKDPEEYENQYTLLNSFWFTMGALMQQGSDVAPIALCVRFAAGMWFFFALIMISSYTANLAAFLTVETLTRPIESAKDLANQEAIKYGAMVGGSTANFFKDSSFGVYQKLWQFMSGPYRSEVMVPSNSAGKEKVGKSDGMFAFFMESSAIEYIIERECEFDQVGGLLDNKGYGIATQRGTPYKNLLDKAILTMLESGFLHKARVRWWKQRRGGGACEGKGGEGGVAALQLESVSGVFVVTILGCFIAAVFAVIEFLVGTRQSAKAGGKTWLEEMTRELRFILKCHGNTKEVDTAESGSGSHSSNLSLDEPAYSARGEEPAYTPRPRVGQEPIYNRSRAEEEGEEPPTYMGRGNPESVYNRSVREQEPAQSPAAAEAAYRARNGGLESPYGSRPPASLRSADAASSAASKPGSKASLSGLSLPDESKAGNPFEAADDD